MIKICFTVASLNTYNKLRNINKSPYIRAFSSKDLFDCCLIGSLKKTYIHTEKLVNMGFDFIKLFNYLLIAKSGICR